MKLNYSKPATEVQQRYLESTLLDGSIDGVLDSYGDENEFTW